MPDPMGGIAYTWPLFTATLGGYLLGTVPFGLILARLAGFGDIRTMGSGNIGATNVLRTGSKSIAALTLLLDAGKGVVAVLIAARFGPDTAVLAGLGAVFGHVFPVWLGFRGGKGVATTFGVALALSWPAGLAALAVWLLTAAVFRYSSLAAVVAMVALPVFAWLWAPLQVAEVTAAIALLVLLRHAGNIRRLIRGEETRIGQKS